MSTIKAKAFQHPSASSNNITFNADGTHTVNSAYPTINKNLIINGGMDLWQRSTSVSGITGSNYYTVDRFRTTLTTQGTWTQSRSTDVPSEKGFGYSLKMDCTAADASPAAADALLIQQKIEGYNLLHLLKGTSSAKKVTLSFWVKSNKTGTYIIELEDVDNSRHISQSYTISSASTWEKKELTFDGDTTGTFDNDNSASLNINWWLGSGSNHTSGSLATSWASRTQANVAPGQVNLADSTSNEWYLTGVQLEIGEQATGFEFEPFETTQLKCQRYFFMMGGEAIYERFGVGVCRSTTQAFISIHNLVRMRGIPTASINAAGDFQLHDGVAGRAVSSIQMDLPSSYVTHIIVNTSSISGGRGAQLLADNTTNARLSISAELT